MIPRELIAGADVPGGGRLKLFRRGSEWSIMLGGNELMNSRRAGSEEALATLAIGRVTAAAPQVLIGGLGMGFTLRAALAVLPAAARVTVVEIVPSVIDWARGAMAEVFAGCLDDPRVEVIVGDVGRVIAGSRGWHAILLDVDNGPDGLSRAANDRLYGQAGLAATRSALAPGGVLAVWSVHDDPAFTARLRGAGFVVETRTVRAGGARGARNVIWLAR